jgi:hypothetical protein
MVLFSAVYSAIISVLLLVEGYRAHRQSAPLRRVAVSLGLPLNEDYFLEYLKEHHPRFPLFRVTGYASTAPTHCLHGSFEGRDVTLVAQSFTGEFPTRRDEEPTQLTVQQTLVIVCARCMLPNFWLAPRNSFADRVVGGWLIRRGRWAMGPLLHRACNEAYVAGAKDVPSVCALLTLEVQEYFAAAAGWVVQSWDDEALVYQEGVAFAPDDYPRLLHAAVEIVKLLEEAASAPHLRRTRVRRAWRLPPAPRSPNPPT